MKQYRYIIGIITGLLIVASLVVSFRQQLPEAVARRECAEHGYLADKIALLDYRRSGFPFDKSETIEFQIKGSSKVKLVVELKRPTYFLPWHVLYFVVELVR